MKVAVVGATGAVGAEMVRLLQAREFPVNQLRLFASERSAGAQIDFKGRPIQVEVASEAELEGTEVAFFSAGATTSKRFAPGLAQAGALVVDNSSAFRMDPSVPLVIPEVNGEVVAPEHRIISVPNCSAIILLAAVSPLRKLGKVDRIIVSTYQSASGGGAWMMNRLIEETEYVLKGLQHPVENDKFPPYAFNLFSHNTKIGPSGMNEEEEKVVLESRKILNDPTLKMNVTCIRVPVLRAHSESITVEFSGAAPSADEVRSVLEATKGITVVDDRANNRFPTPLAASGQGDVLVGRIRTDPSSERGISMFVTGDQLLKGAALTAVEIAELSLKMTSKPQMV